MPSTQYLFLFTIGPVQSFIAQARKTRDLYAGSAILGDIIGVTINYVRSGSGNKIIMPAPDLQAKPNRFIAEVIVEYPEHYADEVVAIAREKWVQLCAESLQVAGIFQNDQAFARKLQMYLEKSVSPEAEFECLRSRAVSSLLSTFRDLPNGYYKQIENFLETHWVAIRKSDNYLSDYNRLQELLGAIKNSRQFDQTDENASRKCSIDGERNALFYRERTIDDKKPNDIQKEALPITLTQQLTKLDPGEALSAVSLAKRFYEPRKSFPSTAAVALLSALETVSRGDDKHVIDDYKALYGASFDDQMFYEENLTVSYLKKHGHAVNAPDALKQHEAVKKAFNKVGVSFCKYYAIIAFDGDSMGKVWSGDAIIQPNIVERFQSTLSTRLQVFQTLLGQRLGIYATFAKVLLEGNFPIPGENTSDNTWHIILDDPYYKTYFEKLKQKYKNKNDIEESGSSFLTRQKGKAVYAGGDDFLGFVNLQYLFRVMRELREAYDTLVSEPLKDYMINKYKLTFSAGVAIAHYKKPLSEVLKWTREMERKAKGIDDDKNAFAIAVLKQTGDIEVTRYKWYGDGQVWFTEDFDRIIAGLMSKQISNTFIMVLSREFRRLADNRGTVTFIEPVHLEIHRLISRSFDSQVAVVSVDQLYDIVKRLFDACVWSNPVTGQTSNTIKNLYSFLSALNICDFIKRTISDE